jgi:hypothetical protein
MQWLGEAPLPSPAQDKGPPAQAHAVTHHSASDVCTCICLFYPLSLFGGVAVGHGWLQCSLWWWQELWMRSGPFPWTALATAGSTAVPRESNGAGRHPQASASLLPSWEGGVRAHVWHGGPHQSSLPPGPPLWPTVPPPMHVFMSTFTSFWGSGGGLWSLLHGWRQWR